jgi:hypothetical protein
MGITGAPSAYKLLRRCETNGSGVAMQRLRWVVLPMVITQVQVDYKKLIATSTIFDRQVQVELPQQHAFSGAVLAQKHDPVSSL